MISRNIIEPCAKQGHADERTSGMATQHTCQVKGYQEVGLKAGVGCR